MSLESAQRPELPAFGGTTEWLLTRFQRLPPGSRLPGAGGVAAMILAIGWVDHVTGTQLSLVAIYLIPVAVATPWFGRVGGVLTSFGAVAVRFTADAINSETSVLDAWLWWNSLAGLLVYVVVVWSLDALMRFQRHLEERVRLRTAELEAETRRRHEVQRQLLELSASERSAMGRELHDQLGQHLVGTAMAAQVLAQRLQTRDESGGREARTIAALIEQGIAQTRQLAHGMLLTQLVPRRLPAEFEELCATFRQQYPRLQCECVIEAPPLLPDAAAAAQVFRIGQEALRNALRHSGGSRVRLLLSDWEGQFRLRVEDNGVGLPVEQETRGPGLGLSIMRHRAEQLGAEFRLDSTPGQGTRITCLVPVAPAARATP
jgi:signal transduction histidine kinase